MKAFTSFLVILCLCLAPDGHAGGFVDAKIAYLQARSVDPAGTFLGSVRFADRPTSDQIRQLEDLGVHFMDHGRGRLGSRTVYPARIPFAAVKGLAALDFLAAVESALRPASRPMLYYTQPQVETDLAWQVVSPLGGTLTGRGVIIGDIDTGIDYYHPMFFKISEDEFPWIDGDGNGTLSDGDAVDFDGNGQRDTGESLRYCESTTNTFTSRFPNDPTVFSADFDFLYNDANDNLERDYGPPHFTETDPCFGELLFLVNDADGDRLLDSGETLQALGESKVRAIFTESRGIFTREVDLLAADLDAVNHGTPVAGILGGGWAGRHAMSGVAPGAEFLFANMMGGGQKSLESPDSWSQDFMEKMAWTVGEGADIVLAEFGTYVWEFLDGSSNIEIMIDEYAGDQGVIFVTPNGNLAGKAMHSRFASDDGQILRAAADAAEFYISLLWVSPVELAVTLTTPDGVPLDVPGDGRMKKSDDCIFYSNFTISPRGTRRLDLWITSGYGGDSLVGDWVFSFSGPTTPVHGFFADQYGAWESESAWVNGVTDNYTITHPATADSAINVGAYDNLGIPLFENPPGSICDYSGVGPRIDEVQINDLAAPGIFVITTGAEAAMNLFCGFAGTSAAGPFVAGAAALMKELVPDLDPGSCRKFLREGAEQTEAFTDPEHWGSGALRIHAALAPLLADKATNPPTHPELQLAVHPNPFNPVTSIRFYLPEAGEARLRIFSVTGCEVWSRVLASAVPGWREVAWLGQDDHGRPAASGVYFAHVQQGARYMVAKLTLIK